jgi:hypothetical protein
MRNVIVTTIAQVSRNGAGGNEDHNFIASTAHPALLRFQELATLSDLSKTAKARIYIGFDKHQDQNVERHIS